MKPLFIALFLFVLCLVIFISHFFIYQSWLKFSVISHARLKLAVKIFLILLPLVFIIITILASHYDHLVLRSAYFISALWLGLSVNLFFSYLLAWFIYGLSKIFSLTLPLPIFGYFFLVLAFIMTILGTLNALHPAIRKVAVSIDNLPAAWQGQTIVQLSDVHLGYVYGPKFMQSVVEDINQLNPDLILITGDLYDGESARLAESTAYLNDLRSRYGVYFITGNHETFLGLEKTKSLLSATQVKTLSNELVSLDGLDLIGLAYLGEGSAKKLWENLQAVPDFNPDHPAILLYHEPIDIDRIKDSGIDLMLTGHTHRGQLWPFNFITELVYHGFDYGFYRLGNFSLYVSPGAGTWGPPMRTSARSEITVFQLN